MQHERIDSSIRISNPCRRSRLTAPHITRAASNVPVEDVSSALRTTLRMREGCTASITTSSFSKRRETTANLRTAKRRFHARQQPVRKHLRRDRIPIFRLLSYWFIPLWVVSFFLFSLLDAISTIRRCVLPRLLFHEICMLFKETTILMPVSACKTFLLGTYGVGMLQIPGALFCANALCDTGKTLSDS